MSLFEELIEGKKKDKQIVKSFETKETLSNQIFEEVKGHFVMRDEIKKRLIEISDDFIESLGVEFFIHDIILTGSLANYNWSQYSDVDLHILIDFEESKYEMNILKEFFDAKKNVWNEKHDIKIKGYDLSFDSNFQFTEYQTGGHYDWHTDSGGVLSHRYCSLVIQLNDEYDGGELKLIDNNEEIVLEKGIGNLFIFLSSLEHKVEKITKGTRYSLVNWFSLKPIDGFKKTLM